MTTFNFLLILLNILLKSIVESLIEKVMEDIFTCSHFFFLIRLFVIIIILKFMDLAMDGYTCLSMMIRN